MEVAALRPRRSPAAAPRRPAEISRAGTTATRSFGPTERENRKWRCHLLNVKFGDTVKLHFTAMLEDGTVFMSSANRAPLKFTLGTKDIMPGLQKAVVGMKPGENKTAKIPAEEGYGPYRKEHVVELDRKFLPKTMDLRVGQQVRGKHQDGRTTRFRVADVSDSTVTLDANHFLAGKDLVFRLELVEIVASAGERQTEAALRSMSAQP